MLQPWVCGDPHPDAVRGCLYDTGRGYPAALFDDENLDGENRDGERLVWGIVVPLDPRRIALALAALDRYEGREYARITVLTEAGVEAVAYAWTGGLEGCRPIGGGRWAALRQTETPPHPGR